MSSTDASGSRAPLGTVSTQYAFIVTAVPRGPAPLGLGAQPISPCVGEAGSAESAANPHQFSIIAASPAAKCTPVATLSQPAAAGSTTLLTCHTSCRRSTAA